MLTASSSQPANSASSCTIGHIVLKPPRANIIDSRGDGFGAHVERLINVAHETHEAFPHLIGTLQDLIDYIRAELERTYSHYQFSIVVGKAFDHEPISSSHHHVLIEHGGMRVLIFSSTGCSYKVTGTTTDEIDDSSKALVW